MYTAYNVLLSFSYFSPIKVWQFNFVVLVEKSFISEFSAINLNSKEKCHKKTKTKTKVSKLSVYFSSLSQR